MYEIGEMPVQVAASDLSLLRQAETATIGHFRYHGFAQSGIRPAIPVREPVVGTAVTLMLPVLDSTLLHHAVGLLRPGDVLVIDRLGDKSTACLGGGVAYSLEKMGVAGVIIDGPCADPHELREIGLPVWARGLSAVTTRILDIWGKMNIPVSCGGVVVSPGDAVLADENGVVFLRPDEVFDSAKKAVDMQKMEKTALQKVSAQSPIGLLSGATQMVEGRFTIRKDAAG